MSTKHIDTPINITELPPNHIFVFGSNRAGRHGAGAARTALHKFGAKWGQGSGLMGSSYGIPTKGRNLEILSLNDIAISVDKFSRFAKNNADLTFFVTKIGCGLAGYKEKDIKPMFRDTPRNVILPKNWGIHLVLAR